MRKEDKEYVIMAIKEMLCGHYNAYKIVWGEDQDPEDDICRTQLEKALKIIEDEAVGSENGESKYPKPFGVAIDYPLKILKAVQKLIDKEKRRNEERNRMVGFPEKEKNE